MAAAEASPRDFGLRVQRHPSALEVTARNKAGSGQEVTVDVSLSRSMIETTVIHDQGDVAEANRTAARDLHDALMNHERQEVGASILFPSVSSGLVKEFIEKFRNHPDAIRTQNGPVLRYIEERENENLGEWDVVFVGSKKQNAMIWNGLGFPLRLQSRTPASREDGRIVATNRRFSSRGVVRFGMDKDSVVRVRKAAEKEGTKSIADSAFLAKRTRPLLAIHMIALIDRGTGGLDGNPPVTAWTIGFPTSQKVGRTVSYQVNTIWWQQNRGELDEEIGEALDREE